jgi:hypothetical protein
MTVFGDKVFKEVIKLNEVIRVGVYPICLVPLLERERHQGYAHRGEAM